MTKHVTVPVEPTEEMIAAAMKSNYAKESPSFAAVIKADWKAMIAAAPQEPGRDETISSMAFQQLHLQQRIKLLESLLRRVLPQISPDNGLYARISQALKGDHHA